MKIKSRPDAADDSAEIVIGNGTNVLKLSDEQLELIAALVANCRLGQSGYSAAAYEILKLLEEEFGDDFATDAADNVDLQATIEDFHGNVIVSTVNNANQYFVTLEV